MTTISNSQWDKIWDTLIILSMTYNPKGEDCQLAFKCLIECLGELLPDKSAVILCKTFMSQKPIEPYLSVKDGCLDWIYSLYVYWTITKKRQGQLVRDQLTLEQIKSKYEIITKNDWGPLLWFLIHLVAANLRSDNGIVTDETAQTFKAFIVSISLLVPCPDCKQHMTSYMMNTQIGDVIKTPNGAFMWTYKFHNAVNQRLKKSEMPLQTAWNLYHIKKRSDEYDNDVYTVINGEF